MDSSEVAFQIAKVDRMLDRVVKVIGRERPEKPLRPDVSYPRRAKPKPEYVAPAIAQQSPRRHGPIGYSEVDEAFERVDAAERELRRYARDRGQRVEMNDVDRAFEECSNAPY